MYTFLEAFSDTIYEFIGTLLPIPMINFDIEKHPQRLYVYAAQKLKKATCNTVCECVVYCSHILNKRAKNMVFANINITDEGLLSLMRLIKRYKDNALLIDKNFIINEMCKVVKEFNGSAIEAVGEAVINGVSLDEYKRLSGYKKDMHIEDDAMWVLTHKVLNKSKVPILKEDLERYTLSYKELANIYLSENHGINTKVIETYYKDFYCYGFKTYNNEIGTDIILRALHDGIDLMPFLKEKRIKKINEGYINASDYYPVIDGRKLFLKFDDKIMKTMIIQDVLNALYYARLSGVSEENLIKYLREREKLSIKVFYEHINNDMILLEKGILV